MIFVISDIIRHISGTNTMSLKLLLLASHFLSFLLRSTAVSPWKIPQFNHERSNEFEKMFKYQHSNIREPDPSQEAGVGRENYVGKGVPKVEFGRSMRKFRTNPTVPTQVIKVLRKWLQSIPQQQNNAKPATHPGQKIWKHTSNRQWKIPSDEITKKPHTNKIYELKTQSTTLSPEKQLEKKLNQTRDFVIINDKVARNVLPKDESENYIPYRLSKRSVNEMDIETFYSAIRNITKEDLKMALAKAKEFEEKEKLTKCCFNGGTCYKKNGETWCVCPPQYTGRLCFYDINECANNASICPSHSSCVNHHGSYSCVCDPRFVKEGKDCIPQTTCQENPCTNGALCLGKNSEGSFTCICELGFYGDRCQYTLRECDDSPCADHEICISTWKGFECRLTP